MLQKFSKCEIKAWLCRNSIILPPLRFYMKSNFAEIKQSKNVIFGQFGDSELWNLVNLELAKCWNLLKNQNCEPLKLPKLTFLDRINSPKFDFTQNDRISTKSDLNFNFWMFLEHCARIFMDFSISDSQIFLSLKLIPKSNLWLMECTLLPMLWMPWKETFVPNGKVFVQPWHTMMEETFTRITY